MIFDANVVWATAKPPQIRASIYNKIVEKGFFYKLKAGLALLLICY